MRIEKLSDVQIRCTITAGDLSERNIRVGELAYGTEKTRALFGEMLTKASHDFGFQVENVPLVVEAIPLSTEDLVLIITKVEDPEELDTRFSRFSSLIEDGDELPAEEADFGDNAADEVLEELKSIARSLIGSVAERLEEVQQAEAVEVPKDYCQIFRFDSLDDVALAARAVQDVYKGPNSLYRNPGESGYLLVLQIGEHDAETFNRVCNRLSEYAAQVHAGAGTAAYYEEHYRPIVKEHALQTLQSL